MNTRDDIFTQVLVRNNLTTTDTFITDASLKNWFRDAVIWATSYHKWPFTEARDNSAAWSGSEEVPYTTFNPEFKSDSIRVMTIGGKRMKKLNFEDYLIFREESSAANDRVFSDYGRTVYINPNADVSGTLAVYGQEQIAIDTTDETGTTPFSTYDAEGNEAVYEKMSSYLKRRQHLAQEAELHDQRAAAKLDEIWKRILDEQYKYQSHSDRGGMWERIDIINGRPFSDNKENQF